jgi:malate dehydrogenase
MFAAVLGAGELGGALAQRLAARGRFAEVRIIDPARGVATGKALDIQQSLERFATRVVGDDDPAAAAGAAVIAIADVSGPPNADWIGDAALALVKRLAHLTAAPIVCAGASHRGLVAAAVRELHIGTNRIVGTAPGALEAAAKAIVALEIRGSASDVQLSVFGVPPDRVVIGWEHGSVGGASLLAALEPPQRSKVQARVPLLWPPGPTSLAAAAARVVEGLAVGSRRRFTCFAAVRAPRTDGLRVAAVPVELEPGGVHRLVRMSLSVQEQVLFENALEADE